MSYWYEPTKEDIDLTEDGEELHVHIGNDDAGAIYVSLKVEDIKQILNSHDNTKSNKKGRD